MPATGTWLRILARDPSGAKTRLAAVIDPDARSRLAIAMLEDVLAAAADVPFAAHIVATESERVREIARGVGYGTLDVALSDMNGAATEALHAAAARGAARAVVLAADLPLLAADDLTELLAAADEADIVIAPDRRRRGTNALVLAPPLVISSSFGAESYRRHRAAGRRAGARVVDVLRPGLAHDVDGPDDLALLLRAAALGANTAEVVGRVTIGGR